MLYELTATDASFVDGRPPENIHNVLARAHEHLVLEGVSTWKLISGRRRFGKTLFEIEEESAFGKRRLIGKVCKTERAESLYRTLALLRRVGFQPPARFTVPEPVACIPEQGFILQEKAPGRQASDVFNETAGNDCAQWLATLHGTQVAAPRRGSLSIVVSTWAHELADAEPANAKSVRAIGDAVLSALGAGAPASVPCHGDFHPINIFIAVDRNTAIDIDKFAAAPPEADVGYFLMQSAAFEFFKTGAFKGIEARRGFFETYEAHSGRTLDRQLVAAYMAMAFLKNLHFELVLLETGERKYSEPWLWGAETALFERNIFLTS
jgi:aminoglycoside phosphotransferase (APT) family kinase protein